MNFSIIAFSKGYLYLNSENFEKYSSQILNNEIVFNAEEHSCFDTKKVSIQAEVMRYGYMFDEQCLAMIEYMPDEDIIKYCSDLSEYLGNTYGNGEFNSLFGDFPATVLNMDIRTFYTEQILHYLTGGLIPMNNEAGSEKYSNLLCNIHDEYKLIRLANTNIMCDLCKDICSAQQSLTSYDKDAVLYFCNNMLDLPGNIDIHTIIPENIPFKETLCMLASSRFASPKTVTDVLRVAVYMSNGDITLTTPCKFKKFSRPERRLIMSLLENVLKVFGNNQEELYAEMKTHLGPWLRIGEIIHPGKANNYPYVRDAFRALRNESKYINTYESYLNEAYKSKDLDYILSLLEKQPGKFARNVDWILRTRDSYDEQMKVVNSFNKIINKVSLKVIYELIEYYNKRNEEFFTKSRSVFLKGARKPTFIKNLDTLNEDIRQIMLSNLNVALLDAFSEKSSLLGKTVIIEDSISNIMLPTNMRSMNIAPGQQTRGTKIPLTATDDVLRLYVHWKDPNGIYDLDLSTVLYDSNMNLKDTLSWNSNCKLYDNNRNIMCVFSGDVRHKIGNSAEYIDISISRAKAYGIRYVVGLVSDFDRGGFDNMDAWAGVMFRDKFGTPGEKTWAPETVANGFKITSNSNNIIMSIVDLEEMCMIAVDEDLTGIPVLTEHSASSKFKARVQQAIHPKYFNALKLIEMNAKARNANVEIVNKEFIDKIQEQLLTLPKLKVEYSSLCSKDLSETSDEFKRLIKLHGIIKILESIILIPYNDMSADYTKLFKWMF